MRRGAHSTVVLGLLAAVLLAGCSSSDDGSASSTAGPAPIVQSTTTVATVTSGAGTSTTGPAAEAAPWDPVVPEGRLLLGEVGFFPAAGGTAFVEVFNAGGEPVDLGGALLVDDGGREAAVPAGSLGPGEVLSIPVGGFLREAGEVLLVSGDGETLDRVAWGAGMPDAVRLGRAGVLPEPVPGFTIGRAPTDAAVSADAWSYFGPDEATPGARNPRPAVGLLLPVDGSIVGPATALSWYPVAGAVRYRVQVAADEQFADPLVDAEVEEAAVQPDLSPGDYVWRVEAVGADGRGAGWSTPSRIVVEEGISAEAAAGLLPAGGIAGQTAAYRYQAAANRLAVPLLAQRKDTGMLEMQSVLDSGAHAWNSAHAGFDAGDKSDNMNCVLASTAMINAFFGGAVSQDRLGYEILGGTAAGPETDLNYGRGFSYGEVSDILAFALGGRPSRWNTNGDDRATWEKVKGELDAGRPVLAVWVFPGGGAHATVVAGYEDRPDGRFLRINDPWGPAHYLTPLGAGAQGNLPGSGAATLGAFYTIPAAAAARDDEPEVAADGDGDGVTDFDEARRFGTNPGSADTDGDGIGDFDEIRATAFDPTHGHIATGDFSGRDIDGDGSAMELDTDADDGGCDDGLEDADRDGDYAAGSETHNFESDDDACYRLEMQVNAENDSSSMTIVYGGQFSVLPDGGIIGGGTGTVASVDREAPCIDVDAGEVRDVVLQVDGSFSFDIEGAYRVGEQPAGRLPQPGDAGADYAIEMTPGPFSFDSAVVGSECTIEQENFWSMFLQTLIENPNWFVGVFEGPVLVPAGVDEIPDIPINSQLLQGFAGSVAMDVEQVGKAAGG